MSNYQDAIDHAEGVGAIRYGNEARAISAVAFALLAIADELRATRTAAWLLQDPTLRVEPGGTPDIQTDDYCLYAYSDGRKGCCPALHVDGRCCGCGGPEHGRQ